jgi:CRP/FNR family nitrogen fixation transcriptional regulator
MQVSIQSAPVAAARIAPPRIAEPDTLDLLEQFGTTLRLQREQEVVGEGDAADYCYRIVSGSVRLVRLMEDGRRQVAEFLLPGEIFGLDVIGTHDFAAEVVTDAVLRRYPRRMVDALAESRPALARRLRELALAHLRSVQERLVLLGRKTATERLASFLLEMERRIGRSPQSTLELPMCRTDIADHLGLTVETVCRVLAHMKRDSVLTISRTGVGIRDRAALRALASDMRH